MFGLDAGDFGRPVKFNTGLCLLLSSIALLLQHKETISLKQQFIIQLCAIIVLIIAGVTVAEYISGTGSVYRSAVLKEKIHFQLLSIPAEWQCWTSSVFTVCCCLLITDAGKALVIIHTGYSHLLSCNLIAYLLNIYNADTGESVFGIHSRFTTYVYAAYSFIGAFFCLPLRYLKFSFQEKSDGFLLIYHLVAADYLYHLSAERKTFQGYSRLAEHTNSVMLQNLEVKGSHSPAGGNINPRFCNLRKWRASRYVW